MKSISFRSLSSYLVVFALLILLSPSVLAIGIRPIRSEFNIKPGESVTGEITVINETEKDFMAEPVVKVFYKNDETGYPVYPTPEEIKENEMEDFAAWIDLPKEPVLVKAKESTTVKYTVSIPKEATAGGKYATLAYQPVKNPDGGVAVNVRAASLLFVNVEGEVIRSAELKGFGLKEDLQPGSPFSFQVSLLNTGNTHIKPHGEIEIIDKKTGEKLKGIAKYIDEKTGMEVVGDAIPVNLRKKNVLPESLRTFEAEWNNGLKEGEFEAVLNLKYDDQSSSVSQTVDFSIKEEMEVTQFELQTENEKTQFLINILNKGTHEEKIKGVIEVKNSLGYQVGEVRLPEDLPVLKPGEKTDVILPWEVSIPPGRYKATLKLEYGFTEKTTEKALSFGELDKVKVAMGVGLGITILVAIWGIFMKKKRRR